MAATPGARRVSFCRFAPWPVAHEFQAESFGTRAHSARFNPSLRAARSNPGAELRRFPCCSILSLLHPNDANSAIRDFSTEFDEATEIGAPASYTDWKGGCAAHCLSAICSRRYGRRTGRQQHLRQGRCSQQTYPAQLEAILRAQGLPVHVINAGINGDTTAGMLSRLGRAVPNGTSVVILQPGGNDWRKGEYAERGSNMARIMSRLSARGVKVVVIENQMFRGLPHQSDGMHLTAEGYRMLAQSVAPGVATPVTPIRRSATFLFGFNYTMLQCCDILEHAPVASNRRFVMAGTSPRMTMVKC